MNFAETNIWRAISLKRRVLLTSASLALLLFNFGPFESRASAAEGPPTRQAQIAVNFAISKIGHPYNDSQSERFGQHGAYDCSGLTYMSYQAAGVNIAQSSSSQFAQGPPIGAGSLNLSSLLPGDLVYFRGSHPRGNPPIGHVGIVVGYDQMVDASTFGVGVIRQSISGHSGYEGATRPSSNSQLVPHPSAAMPGSGQSSTPGKATSLVPTLDGKGYWIVQPDGGVFTFGDANFYGSAYGKIGADHVTGMAMTSTGKGYWLVISSGAIYAFGDAQYRGGANTISHHYPIMGIAGHGNSGYWLLGADGGVFTYGSAGFHGSAAGHLTSGLTPAMSINATDSGNGYRITDLNGAIFDFGDAQYHGGANTAAGHKAILSMGARGSSKYIQVAVDGGVYTYGGVPFEGSMAGKSLAGTPTAVALTPSGTGYWIVTNVGAVYAFGNANFYGTNN